MYIKVSADDFDPKLRNAYKPSEYSSRESILMEVIIMKARTMGIVAAAGLAALVGCKSEPDPVQPANKTTVEASITPYGIEAKVKEGNNNTALLYWHADSNAPMLRIFDYSGEECVIFEAMDITNPSVNEICLNYGISSCVELTEETLQYAGLFQKASEKAKAICEKADCEGLYERWKNKQYTIWDDIANAL